MCLTHLYLKKMRSILFSYGWLGLIYGFLGSFLAQEYGFDNEWLRLFIILGSFIGTLWLAYHHEMRYHVPTQKYTVLVLITLLSIIISTYFSFSVPLLFALFLIALTYKCHDCIAFTRLKNE